MSHLSRQRLGGSAFHYTPVPSSWPGIPVARTSHKSHTTIQIGHSTPHLSLTHVVSPQRASTYVGPGASFSPRPTYLRPLAIAYTCPPQAFSLACKLLGNYNNYYIHYILYLYTTIDTTYSMAKGRILVAQGGKLKEIEQRYIPYRIKEKET